MRSRVQTVARKPASLREGIRRATCAQTEKREEFGSGAGESPLNVGEADTASPRRPAPILALRRAGNRSENGCEQVKWWWNRHQVQTASVLRLRKRACWCGMLRES